MRLRRISMVALGPALLCACNGDGDDVAEAEAGYDEEAPSLEEVSMESDLENESGTDPDTVTNEEVAE